MYRDNHVTFYGPPSQDRSQMVEVTLMFNEYQYGRRVFVDGLSQGLEAFDEAIRTVYDDMVADHREDQEQARACGGKIERHIGFVMTAPDGREFRIVDEEDKGVEFLKTLVVEMKIVHAGKLGTF